MTRRTVLAASTAALITARSSMASATTGTLQKTIPKTGEKIPTIGMGSWLTFNVGDNPAALDVRENVLRAFFEHGGGMIDSSPMYGRSEAVIGMLLTRLERPKTAFSATKIWTPVAKNGPKQLDTSLQLWQMPQAKPLELVHVHNLLKWKQHLPMLQAAKNKGTIRYVGLTTSHGRRHGDMEKLIGSQDVDVVQFSYNILDRAVENRLLPAARDNGVAVVTNRPFRTGLLFDKLRPHPLPEWAAELGCENWAQFLLKFVISHPDITCTIPATSQPAHMVQNMKAGTGIMPDAKTRLKMIQYVENL